MGDNARVIPVKVAVRCRPLIQKEENEGCQGCLQFIPGEPQLIVGKDKAFTFDYVFNPNTDQHTVYLNAVSPLVKGLFKGYNATVLAYGQTGSGKTYSMGGGYGVSMDTNEDVIGIIPRVIRDLFDGIKRMQDKFEFIIKVSYLELYKEDLLDLFVPAQKRDKDQVVIRDDVSGGIKLTGMSEIEVHTFEETMKALEEGSQGRTTGATAMNNQSSRSHAIFTIHLDRKNKLDSHDYCKAKFHLVDLAGSERIKKTHAEGERLKEGININKGLLALGNVISALGEESSVRKGHIPYRDSKLTRLLQDSLGGNSHTLMVACVSPADSNIEETVSTLRYADRARKIKNKPIVNQDPQAAEIMRLRALVQELQSKGVTTCKRISIGGVEMEDEQYKSLLEKNRKLEDEKRQLVNELQIVITQNTEMMDKVVRTEMSREKLKEQLEELKEQAVKEMECLKECRDREDTSMQTSMNPETLDQQLSVMTKFKDKLCQIETGDDMDDTNNNTNTTDNDPMTPGDPDGQTDELKSRHVLRQAQLSRELQTLNNMLHKKQELAMQMQSNEKQMQEMKEQYEQQMKEMEVEVEKLQKEKEEAVVLMHSLKSNNANNKLAEQRRKRVQELESQIQQLKKKMTEQMRMLKMKEQNEKQVEKLNQEIISMKQQRVKLMNQLKDDAEQFRKMKAEMTKEVLQLKSQDRKRQAEIAKLERQHVNQQAVLKRKAEEAAAANNRLKEVLMRQKMVLDDRSRKQEAADLSGTGARVKKLVSDEMDLLVSVEEARMHLNQQMSSRKEMNEQATCIRNKLKMSDQLSESMSDDEKSSLTNQLKDMEQQIELCTVQIADLHQKLIDADQDEKSKSRWDNIHTMVEAKVAIKWLLNTAVGVKVESNKKDSEMDDLRQTCSDLCRANELMEANLANIRIKCEQDLYDIRKEHESKILYLLSQLKNTTNNITRPDLKESERIEELKRRIEFQDKEIEKLRLIEEDLNNKTEECNNLRREITKVQYNRTLMRGEGTLMPPTNFEGEIKTEFFSPAILAKKSRKRSKKRSDTSNEDTEVEVVSDEFDEEDDVNKDPDYKSGLTPAPPKPRSRSNKAHQFGTDSSSSSSSTFNRTFITSDTGEKMIATNPSTTTTTNNNNNAPLKKKSGERRRKGAPQQPPPSSSSSTTTNSNENIKPSDSIDSSTAVVDISEAGLNSIGKKRKLQPLKSAPFFTDQI